MTNTEGKALQVKEKQEVQTSAELTQPGVVFTPDVDIFETDTVITLLADMPGVSAGDLNIDIRDNVLTLSGGGTEVLSKQEQLLLKEYDTGKYYRQFTLSKVIDQSKVVAGLAIDSIETGRA